MRRKVIAATLTVLAVSGCNTAHESTSPTLTTTVYVTPTPIATTPPHPAPPVAKGQWAYDEPLDVQVATSSAPDPTCYDYDDLTDYCPQGAFIQLMVYVSNNSTEPHVFRADLQRLVDNQGRSYAAAPRRMKLSDRSVDINPGNTAGPLILYFDVPKDQWPLTLLFHSSATSPGALSQI